MGMIYHRYLTLVLLFLCTVGVCQPQDFFYNKTEVNRNYAFKIQFDGTSIPNFPNDAVASTYTIISGTNTNFGVTLRAVPELSYTDPLPWSNAWITNQKIKLVTPAGTEELTLPLEEPTPHISPQQRGWDVRFASTHFPHLTNVTIRIEATFIMKRYNPSTYLEEESHTVSIDSEIPLKVWNRGWFLATQRGTPGGTQVEAAIESVDTIRPLMLAMNHLADPSTGTSASNQVKGDILPILNHQTYFFALTHGEPGGIFDSMGISTNDPNDVPHFMTFNEIRTAALNNRVDENGKPIPPFNMAHVWACRAGVGGNGTGTPGPGFLMDLSPTGARCVTYFLGNLSELSAPIGNTRVSVSEVGKQLHEKLLLGYSIERAFKLIEDNGYKFANADTGLRVPLQIQGDKKTRLNGYFGGG